MRRRELWLGGGAVAAIIVAAALGQRDAPGDLWDDVRASTYHSGPRGAKGLAQTLRRMGIQVRPWRRPLFDLARTPPARGEMYAFLDIFVPPDEEVAAVRTFVDQGGRIFVAGYTGIERCFGYESRYIGTDRFEELEEPVALAPPDPGWTLPGARRVMERIPAESLLAKDEDTGEPMEPCPVLAPLEHRVLLETADGRAAAVALAFRGGGHAVLVSDVALVNNKGLKETDAGLLVIPWLLGAAPEGGASPSPGFTLGNTGGPVRRVVVDEFHQGFGSGQTMWGLWGAAMGWLMSQPVGASVIQLAVVGLVALLVMAVRFGPARAGIERRRRSPGEHLEALAAGLEGVNGDETAVELMVGGLRRRLGRGGHDPKGGGREWLAALELAMPAGSGRLAARRLKWLVTQPGGGGGGGAGGDDRVLAAAQAVEDVWEQLHPRKTRD